MLLPMSRSSHWCALPSAAIDGLLAGGKGCHLEPQLWPFAVLTLAQIPITESSYVIVSNNWEHHCWVNRLLFGVGNCCNQKDSSVYISYTAMASRHHGEHVSFVVPSSAIPLSAAVYAGSTSPSTTTVNASNVMRMNCFGQFDVIACSR